MEDSSNKYYQAELNFYGYLLNTCKYQIVYDRLSNKSVMIYSDLDWAEDPESCRYMTGYFTLIAHRVIFWMSQ